MFSNIITKLLDSMHIIFASIPILIYMSPVTSIKPYIHWLLLIMIMTPLHWVFIDNQCILTMISKYFGDYKNTETDSGFTVENCQWLYKPIMNRIGWQWNNNGINKMVTLHWIINILLVWYYAFYIV